ncbi:hypothetical protein LSH36_108g07041 [Paralvinella palmiformis]|uniref:Uncharacterized protein n=1 Tax=Paralvinella palmiformis TaxID=53620 RepID=A0AAD9JZR2_9ANNE|nr:hypothetical protein LSH36_108g07041 [Paralvinella palmiformis]
MKMTDFADVEWDADATRTTDMMIQSLFHPPLARKKRKKLCSKVKKSFDGAAAENHITKDKKSSKKEKTPRKRKLKADDKSENNNLGKQTELFVDNVTETSQKKDETPQISVRGDHIPRKIRKNKYYTLSLAQRSTKCDVTVKDKNPIILNNDPGLSKSLNCTKVKRKLNKSIL